MPRPIPLAFVLLLAAAGVRASEPARVAFLGLRPTESASLSGTALAALPEAQRLRALAENVVEMVSGASVLRHEDLRGALGPAYLVDLFGCLGEVSCQLRVAAPLGRLGVGSAVAGDYHAGPDAFRIRLRRLDLAKRRLADERTFVLPRAEAGSLAAWRAALAPLFEDTGALRIVTNVAEAECALDGQPCRAAPDGLVSRVPEGEHLLELVKAGYRRAHRVVVVRRREEVRVALPLEELPVQAQQAPDPNARRPAFEAPGLTTRVAPFGFLRLALGWDDVNAGYREDPLALPRLDGVEQGGFFVLPRPIVAGLTVQAPRTDGGWQLRGALSTAWVKEAGPEIDSAFAEVVKEEAGFRLMLGWGPPIVSSLTAGTLTLPEGFGDLAAGLVGVTLSKSLGPFLLEGFVGRQKAQFSSRADPAVSSPGPFGAAHVAFVSERLKGKLYGEPYPLTIGVSGVYGAERVGLAEERAWAAGLGIAAPAREDLPVFAASLEAYVPFGRHGGFAGEAYLGEDVRLLEGALWQGPRVHPDTGRHTALRSAGGWAQLSLNAGAAVEVRLVAGADRILEGLDAGLAPDGAPPVRENRLAAVNAVWYVLPHLAVGAQVHSVWTTHAEPSPGVHRLVGVMTTSQLKF